MSAISAAVVTGLAKVLAPVVNDLYSSAKGGVKKNLEKWSALNGVKGATKALIKVESVKTIWSPDKELLLHEFYYPSRVVSLSPHKTIKNIEGVGDLPEGNVVIQGTVGQGKSIFMRYLASSAIRNDEVKSIPIFLEFRNFSTKRTLAQSIQKFIESIGVIYSDETFAYLAVSGRLILLLDGFDELSEDCVVETIQEIEFLQAKFPEIKIIISSRPKNEIQKVGGFSIINLMPLNKDDYDSFLKKLNIPTVKRVELIDAIAGSPSNISGIIQSPLMLTLVVMVYQSERIIPPTLPEFFESLFQVVFTKHDRLKAGFYRKHHSGLSERKLQRLFEAFCFMAIQMGYGRTLKDSEFNSAFEYALDYAEDCKCDVDNFRKDIVKVACLMLEEGLDLTTFLHKSILDYHAAAFIKNSSADVAKLFYESVTDTSYRRWSAVLSFLENIDAYRYSNDYILVELPSVLAELDSVLLRRTDSVLLDYMETRHPNFKMTYLEDCEVESFGPMTTEKGLWDDYIDMAIFDSVSHDADGEPGQELIREIFENSAVVEGVGKRSKLHMSFDDHIKLFGSDTFWDLLAEADAELHNMLDKAESAVRVQDKRKLIFDRKPKKGD